MKYLFLVLATIVSLCAAAQSVNWSNIYYFYGPSNFVYNPRLAVAANNTPVAICTGNFSSYFNRANSNGILSQPTTYITNQSHDIHSDFGIGAEIASFGTRYI